MKKKVYGFISPSDIDKLDTLTQLELVFIHRTWGQFHPYRIEMTITPDKTLPLLARWKNKLKKIWKVICE